MVALFLCVYSFVPYLGYQINHTLRKGEKMYGTKY